MQGRDALRRQNPRNQRSLEEENQRLRNEIKDLRAQLHGSFFELDDTIVKKSTGFESGGIALWELNKCSALSSLKAMDRHGTVFVSGILGDAAKELKSAFPGISDEVDAELEALLFREAKNRNDHETRGRETIVDDRHLFLVPFLYIIGCFLEWMSVFLPGIRVSGGHFSRLLNNSLPIVVQYWVPRYFQVRNIDWLRRHCSPRKDDPGGVDCVLFWDGCKIGEERSEGMREQRSTYSSISLQNILQFIGVTNAYGWFVAASTMVGGQSKEVDMVWSLDLWEQLNSEAVDRGIVFWIHAYVDRGFRNNKKKVDEEQRSGAWPWNGLKLTIDIVKHLGTDEEPQRLQHPPEEVELNRSFQAKRWVNEKAFAYFKIARFYNRVVRNSVAHHIDGFKSLALAVANMEMGVPPVE